MELRDLYDGNRNFLDKTIKKGKKIPLNTYYVTVVIFIENSNGEFLVQKRSEQKGGKWAFTGGHPVAGQTSLEGIINEVKEELGCDISKNQIDLFSTIKTEDDFVDLYYLKKDIDIQNLVLQEVEVEAVKWLKKEEIDEMINNNQFLDAHVFLYKECLNYLATGIKHPIKRQACRGIIIENDEVILLYRKKNGKIYYSIPGGGVEKGETLEETVVRELKEELNADIVKTEYLGYDETQASIYHYFKCEKANDDLKIIGPERKRMQKNNYYEIQRIKIADLDKLPVFGKEAIMREYKKLR